MPTQANRSGLPKLAGPSSSSQDQVMDTRPLSLTLLPQDFKLGLTFFCEGAPPDQGSLFCGPRREPGQEGGKSG